MSNAVSRRHDPRLPRVVALGLTLTLVTIASTGCDTITPRSIFSHQFHRERYRLTDEEIKGLQFFASSQVLAQTESADVIETPTGGNVILVKRETPGVVTEVGPNWIRVSFKEGGSGMHFLSNAGSRAGGSSDYYIATTVEGSSELSMVKDVPGHIAIHDGVRYKVVEGFNMMLSCDRVQLQALFDDRGIGEGRTK